MNVAEEAILRPDKRLATLKARAALAAATLHAIENDRGVVVYVGTRWAWTKEMSSLDEVEAWVGRLEGTRR